MTHGIYIRSQGPNGNGANGIPPVQGDPQKGKADPMSLEMGVCSVAVIAILSMVKAMKAYNKEREMFNQMNLSQIQVIGSAMQGAAEHTKASLEDQSESMMASAIAEGTTAGLAGFALGASFYGFGRDIAGLEKTAKELQTADSQLKLPKGTLDALQSDTEVGATLLGDEPAGPQAEFTKGSTERHRDEILKGLKGNLAKGAGEKIVTQEEFLQTKGETGVTHEEFLKEDAMRAAETARQRNEVGGKAHSDAMKEHEALPRIEREKAAKEARTHAEDRFDEKHSWKSNEKFKEELHKIHEEAKTKQQEAHTARQGKEGESRELAGKWSSVSQAIPQFGAAASRSAQAAGAAAQAVDESCKTIAQMVQSSSDKMDSQGKQAVTDLAQRSEGLAKQISEVSKSNTFGG